MYYSHPDTISREYSQSSYQDNSYEKWTALISVTAQSIFLIYEKMKKCRMLRESNYRHILMETEVDLYIYI